MGVRILFPVLKPGSKLGRYEIHSQLGAGGMGEVYLAQDTRLDRKVAIKVLPAELSADPARMKRFVQEAKSASGLNHPNIITIYEIDQTGSTAFIAAEFIEGSTLRERMRSPVSVAEALNVAVQVASALTAAHASGIVHRDIKPENVIVRSDGIAKVLDFGLAKLSGPGSPEWVDSEAPTRSHLKTDSGVVMGTATYMSPEQARGQPVDARTDIFSLGVVIYELLTGHLPFEGATIYEIMAAILSDREAPPLSRYSSEAPAELDRIVNKALRKNREERYQTSKDLLLDLQSLRQHLEFERTHRTNPAREDRAVRATRTGPRRIPLWGALGILFLVGVAIGYAVWTRAHVAGQSDIKSLAVLPLKSLGAGENYLGVGIADATIRRVSQTGRLIVRPTSAVYRYVNGDTDALAAAKQLDVDSVLEGSVQRADDRLRVSVNLLRSRDGASLWSDSFDLRMADIFTVQDTVAQQVASRLRLQLDASQQAQLTKHYTSNPIAYEFYLKGAYNFDQRVRGPQQLVPDAIDFYKKAIEADPNFALAHARLAYAYATRGVFLEPTEPTWVQLAKEEINRAQALDPQLAETHLARFQLLYSEFEGYQGEAATRELLMANQLDPNVGHDELAYMYIHLGLEDLAARELARALEIDPTGDKVKSSIVLMYEVQSKYDEYVADKSVPHDDKMQALYFMAKGQLAEAQKVIDEWPPTRANYVEQPPTKALFFALKGDFRAAEGQIPITLKKHPLKDPLYHHAAYDIACVFAIEGKSAEAVKWLRESAVNGYHLYPRYTRDPFLSRIRQAPEFIQFLAEMKAENDRYRTAFPSN
jgi:TolB-like protein/tRNA A-37 threonylcarbamoyl transferase component Bud32